MELTELSDRVEITEVLHRYCDGIDRRDLESVLALFRPDAAVDMGRGAVFTGHDELRALITDRLGRWPVTSHHCSTVSFTRYAGSTAETTSYLYVLHDDPAGNRATHLWGRYEDRLNKEGGAWRFHRRKLLVAAVREATSSPLPERFDPVASSPVGRADQPAGLPLA